MDEQKLAQVIGGIVGTRTYLPISLNEGLIVLERKGYIHIIHSISSVFGSTNPNVVAEKLLTIVKENGLSYHPELLELINGL